jgi:hypothetical protein
MMPVVYRVASYLQLLSYDVVDYLVNEEVHVLACITRNILKVLLSISVED